SHPGRAGRWTPMRRITSLTVVLAGSLAAAGIAVATGRAAAATPTTTATATPTPNPAFPTVHVRVVDDVNENGVEDAGERGLGEAQIYAGCGDARTPATTGATGDALIPVSVAPGLTTCVNLQRQFGWLPIGELTARVPL